MLIISPVSFRRYHPAMLTVGAVRQALYYLLSKALKHIENPTIYFIYATFLGRMWDKVDLNHRLRRYEHPALPD